MSHQIIEPLQENIIEKKVNDLFTRNLISNVTVNRQELVNLIKSGTCKLYIGIDPTSDKYHIGHLVPYMLVLRLLELGVKVVILVGGFTGSVGDPSFKNTERPIMSGDEVTNNTKSLMDKLQKFFGKYGDKIEYVNNNNWLSKMSLSDFLQYSSYFSANRLMKMEHIKQRLDNELPLTFKEVCYTLLQAIDFYYLFDSKEVNMQIGGNDQWINIINGVHLIHSITNKQSLGLIVQLLLNSKGKKMGKTEEGAIWADGTMDMYSFWQYFRNLPDEDIKNFLYIFSMDSVADIHKRLNTEDINQSKIYLADTMVKLVYGENTVNNDEETLSMNSSDLISLLTDLEFAENRSEAKRHINSGAVRINGEKVEKNIIFTKEEEMSITLGKSKRKKIYITLTKDR